MVSRDIPDDGGNDRAVDSSAKHRKGSTTDRVSRM